MQQFLVKFRSAAVVRAFERPHGFKVGLLTLKTRCKSFQLDSTPHV